MSYIDPHVRADHPLVFSCNLLSRNKLELNAMAYTVAITNQKGGVGKTTTAVNLAAALAIAERRTLLVDADPQGNTTSGVGIAKLELQVSLYDVLVDEHPARDVILPVSGLRHLSVLPATQDLVGAELQLVERPFRESALRRVLEPLEQEYDYIVVDCPPSLGLLTLNVLAAVQQLIIPIQCEYYGLEGISQLLNTVRLVQQNINPGLAIGGVLLTMYDSRLNLCRQVAEDATEYFGPKVFGTPIPRNVRLAEAPSFGKPILLYDMHSVGAKSYLAVAQELLQRVEGAEVTIGPEQIAAATAQPPSDTATAPEEQSGEELAELQQAVTQEFVAESSPAEASAPETTTPEEASEPPASEISVPEVSAAEAIAASEPITSTTTEASTEQPDWRPTDEPPSSEPPSSERVEEQAVHVVTEEAPAAPSHATEVIVAHPGEEVAGTTSAADEAHSDEATANETDHRPTDASEPRPEVTT